MKLSAHLKIAFIAIAVTASVIFFSSPALAMTISIQPQIGDSYSLDVEPSDTIENVKTKIQDETGAPPDTTCLLFEGEYLTDGTSLSDYGIGPSAVLNQYQVPSHARWIITPDEPILGFTVYNYLDTVPLHPTSWQVVDGTLPDGVTLNESTGIVEGNFAATGPFSVTIRATNTCGSADMTWSGTVVESLSNTGVDTATIAIWTSAGAALLTAGAAVLLVMRHRKRNQ